MQSSVWLQKMKILQLFLGGKYFKQLIAEEPTLESETTSGKVMEMQTDLPANQLIANCQQAIQAGFLIDVSTDAQKIGLTFPVTEGALGNRDRAR